MLTWVRKFNGLLKAVTAVGFVVAAFVFLTACLTPDIAVAQGDTFGLTTLDQNVNLGNSDIRVVIARIIRTLLTILGAVVVSIIVYAGYVIMTAAGNDERVATGRKILQNAVIGLAIIMMSWGIATWVINTLSDAINPSDPSLSGGPIFDTFSGSGSLGTIVKDHYPFRDQTGVKRNTKVAVTFAIPIDPASIIEDTNESGVVGDCLFEAESFSYKDHCDHYLPNSFALYQSIDPEDPAPADPVPVLGSAMALYEDGEEQNVYTLVFDPFEFLGADGQIVPYTVQLSNEILTKEVDGKQEGIFASVGGAPYYEWEFVTDGELDLEAPIVSYEHPAQGTTNARNEVVQIHFSEAMDPTMVQGLVTENEQIQNIIFNSDADPTGEWKITNGYQTVEFHSNQACGQNSCGEPMYCLPLTCTEKDCAEMYTMYVKSAKLIKPGVSFESVPFSGVMDMAGNALDGDKNKVPDDTPNDDFEWDFTVENKIDRAAPYIRAIEPGVDAQEVSEEALLSILFSRNMFYSTLYNIKVDEHPVAIDETGEKQAEWWVKPQAEPVLSVDGTSVATKVEVKHRVFGPNGLDLYYFPHISQEVRSSNQNCYYPGRGPDENGGGFEPVATCTYTEDEDGNPVLNQNCVAVVTKDDDGKVDHKNDTGCVTKNPEVDPTRTDIAECLSADGGLKDPSISPQTN